MSDSVGITVSCSGCRRSFKFPVGKGDVCGRSLLSHVAPSRHPRSSVRRPLFIQNFKLFKSATASRRDPTVCAMKSARDKQKVSVTSIHSNYSLLALLTIYCSTVIKYRRLYEPKFHLLRHVTTRLVRLVVRVARVVTSVSRLSCVSRRARSKMLPC